MTEKKVPVVQQMAEANPAPNAAEQAKAEKDAAKEHAAAEHRRLHDYERGYHEIKYHGVTMYELNNDRTAQYADERDAQLAVVASRVQANLTS